jgi:hypothetical protein
MLCLFLLLPSLRLVHPAVYNNVTHLISDEGAVGSAPQLRDNMLCNRNACTGPFFIKIEGPCLTQSQAGPKMSYF